LALVAPPHAANITARTNVPLVQIVRASMVARSSLDRLPGREKVTRYRKPGHRLTYGDFASRTCEHRRVVDEENVYKAPEPEDEEIVPVVGKTTAALRVGVAVVVVLMVAAAFWAPSVWIDLLFENPTVTAIVGIVGPAVVMMWLRFPPKSLHRRTRRRRLRNRYSR
jgi:hypothetical protein